jgi:hypothetical protein
MSVQEHEHQITLHKLTIGKDVENDAYQLQTLHRTSDRTLTRNRSFSFAQLIELILGIGSTSRSDELAPEIEVFGDIPVG